MQKKLQRPVSRWKRKAAITVISFGASIRSKYNSISFKNIYMWIDKTELVVTGSQPYEYYKGLSKCWIFKELYREIGEKLVEIIQAYLWSSEITEWAITLNLQPKGRVFETIADTSSVFGHTLNFITYILTRHKHGFVGKEACFPAAGVLGSIPLYRTLSKCLLPSFWLTKAVRFDLWNGC